LKVDANDDRKRLGARLRDARESRHFSKSEVADDVGMARTAVILVESGQRKLDALELKKLANLYGRPVSYFIDEEANDPSSLSEIKHLVRAASRLSPRQLAQLLQFAEFLRHTPGSHGASS
jgi:transcriptional regulator with XRE-family HTH domain